MSFKELAIVLALTKLMGKIEIKNCRIYAYHGCLEEESKIGSDYRVDVKVKTDLNKSSHSDNLSDTVDYVHLNKIITNEMAQRAKLLEHVANRIISRIFEEIEMVKSVKIAVSKLNPPIGGDVEAVIIVMKRKR